MSELTLLSGSVRRVCRIEPNDLELSLVNNFGIDPKDSHSLIRKIWETWCKGQSSSVEASSVLEFLNFFSLECLEDVAYDLDIEFELEDYTLDPKYLQVLYDHFKLSFTSSSEESVDKLFRYIISHEDELRKGLVVEIYFWW